MATRRERGRAGPGGHESDWEPDLGDPRRDSATPASGGPLIATSRERIKEACRLIRLARSHWDAHHNAACRQARTRALALYESLSPEERDEVPQVLRVWLRYRSEKYYGPAASRPRKRARGRGRQPGGAPGST